MTGAIAPSATSPPRVTRSCRLPASGTASPAKIRCETSGPCASAASMRPAGASQRPAWPPTTTRAAREVQHQVVAPRPPGEVLGGVVDHLVGADRGDQAGVARAAYAGDLRAERAGDLHGEGADAARRAVDQDLLAGPQPAVVAQAAQGGQRRHRHGRRLLVI